MKCSSCSNEATGIFWVAYHNSTEIVLAELSCEECAWNDSEYWYFVGGKPRETGFIPGFFPMILRKYRGF